MSGHEREPLPYDEREEFRKAKSRWSIADGIVYDYKGGIVDVPALIQERDALAERLHRATEFLHHVISCSGKGEWPHDEAVAALEAIGPLPPLPKEQQT